MEKLLTRYHWLKLNQDQRNVMREEFNIPKSGGVEMFGNEVKSDGSNETDLKAVNVASMQKFLNTTETNFDELLQATIEKTDEIIAERDNFKKQVDDRVNASNRSREIEEMVGTVIHTIANLPEDAQVAVIYHFKHLLKENKSHGNTEERKTAEEAEEGGDELGTKKPRGRSKATAGAR